MGLVQPIMTWGLNTNMRDQGLHFIYVSISILLQTQTDHLIVLLIILNSTQWIHTVHSIKVKYLLCLSLPLQAQRRHWKLLQQSSSDALSITIIYLKIQHMRQKDLNMFANHSQFISPSNSFWLNSQCWSHLLSNDQQHSSCILYVEAVS